MLLHTHTHMTSKSIEYRFALFFSLYLLHCQKKILANCWCKFISPLLFFLLFFYCAAAHTNIHTLMQELLGIMCVYAACVYVHTRTRYVFRTSLCCESTHTATQIQAPNTLHSPTHKHTHTAMHRVWATAERHVHVHDDGDDDAKIVWATTKLYKYRGEEYLA